jgi:large subunit ribosomal protein L15
MDLKSIKPPKGARKNRKRLGIGRGTGQGKTAGRGENGQKSRSGGGVPVWFEGGQMPLQRRLPKIGFNRPQKVIFQIVNLDQLSDRKLTGDVTLATLREAGLIRNMNRPVKVLGRGSLESALQVSVHAVSQSARDKITQAGGSVHLLSGASTASQAPEESGDTPSSPGSGE